MLRPLFAESSPLDEVLASVRAESASLTSHPARYRAVIFAVLAAVAALLLAIGLISLILG